MEKLGRGRASGNEWRDKVLDYMEENWKKIKALTEDE